MHLISLVENTSETGMEVKHALSLYIETGNHKILFDVGQNQALFHNAEKKNINLKEVDTVVISHGHKDHGGALKNFLDINNNAQIYVQKKAFEPHYTKAGLLKVNIGLDRKLMNHPQIKLLDGNYKIDSELILFTVNKKDRCWSNANDALLDSNGMDRFDHEQNLIISENEKNYLIMGCGHCGVVNIMAEAEKYHPLICVGGFHLSNPLTRRTVSSELLDEIADVLEAYKDTHFYTCHCTGEKAYKYLEKLVPNLSYLHCGDGINI